MFHGNGIDGPFCLLIRVVPNNGNKVILFQTRKPSKTKDFLKFTMSPLFRLKRRKMGILINNILLYMNPLSLKPTCMNSCIPKRIKQINFIKHLIRICFFRNFPSFSSVPSPSGEFFRPSPACCLSSSVPSQCPAASGCLPRRLLSPW